MPAAEALAALPALLGAEDACIGVAHMHWGEAARALAVLGEPCFAAVREAAGAAVAEGDLREALRGADEATATQLLREALAAEIARILRLPVASVTPDSVLGRLGLDSLGGMELRVALEQRLGQPVPLTAVTDTLTVEALARRIAASLTDGARKAEAGADALIAAHEPGRGMEAAA
jgi:acyl carrier protein